MSRTYLMACAVACLACVLIVPAAAQEREGTLPMPEYVLEIGKDDGCMFAPIRRAGNQGLLQYTLPRSAAQPPDSATSLSVSVVNFSARLNGDVWNISVTVWLGEFFDASWQQVASFSARTGERVLVTEVTRFGLSPFRMAVVKVLGQPARAPRFSNRTQSIIAEKIEANALPDPYHVFLRNKSDKDMMAVQYQTYKNRQLLFLKWLEAGPDQPLIKAGDIYRLDVLSEDHTCAEADGYRPAQSDKTELITAVFGDGSYEGEPGLAALIKGDAIGNRKHLPRVVAALNELSGREVLSAAEVIYQLRALAATLDEAADSYLLDELQSDFPMLGPESVPALSNNIRHGQHEVKNYLLGDVAQLEHAGSKTQEEKEVAVWLARTKAKYEHWLAVAEKMTAR